MTPLQQRLVSWAGPQRSPTRLTKAQVAKAAAALGVSTDAVATAMRGLERSGFEGPSKGHAKLEGRLAASAVAAHPARDVGFAVAERAPSHLDRVKAARALLGQMAEAWKAWGTDKPYRPAPELGAFFALSDAAAAKKLEAIENPTPAERSAATEKNRGIAKRIADKAELPSPLLAHATHLEGAVAILESANVDAMFLGNDPHETPTTGVVDFTQISSGKGAMKSKTVLEHVASFGELALLYDPARLGDQAHPLKGTEYNDHWGYPIAAPNTALAAVQWVGPGPMPERTLKALTDTMAARDLYVPIVSAAGKLLFSPAEFEARAAR